MSENIGFFVVKYATDKGCVLIAAWGVPHPLPRGGVGWSVCFDPADACVAAWVPDGQVASSVIVHTLDGGGAPQRFPDANAQGSLAFSADGRFLFAAGAGEAWKSSRFVCSAPVVHVSSLLG